MIDRLAQQAGQLGSLAVVNSACTDRVITMSELVASISHELNQPLAAIVANAESCLSWIGKEQPDITRVRKAAERIVKNGQHASAVLASIRALAGGSRPVVSELDLNEVIRDILNLMRTELSRYDVVLQIELCRSLGRIRGNRTQLQQVLLNLIKNAIESMRESDIRPLLVRVSTAMSGVSAVITVEDSGAGFDSAALGRMFEPFFTTKRQGMGVGLSICRSIVEAHGGVLWANRAERQGAVFQFTLPLICHEGSTENQGSYGLLKNR